MEDFGWLLAVMVVLGLALGLARRDRRDAWWSAFRRPVSKIGDGRQGLVHIVGRVSDAGVTPVQAPVSRVPCLFYDCIVEADGGDDESSRRVRREYRGVWFQLDDGTGTALVRFADSGQAPAIPLKFDGPPLVTCAIPFDGKVEGLEVRPALEQLCIIRPVDELPRKMYAREGRIMPGDQVSVAGVASFEIDPTGFEHRGPPRRYVITHGSDEPLFIDCRRDQRS
jgi:hypothetical protein